MITTTRNRLLGRRSLRRPELPRRPKIYQGRRGVFLVTGLHRTRWRLGLIRSAAIWLRRGALIAVVLLGVSLYIPTSPWTTWAGGLQNARLESDARLIQAIDQLTSSPALGDIRHWMSHLIVNGRLHSGTWIGVWLLVKVGGSFVVFIVSRPLFAWVWPQRLTVKITPRAVWVWRWGGVPWRFPHRPGVPMIFRRIDLPPKATVIGRPMSQAESRDVARRQRVLADSARLELIYGSRRVLLGEVLGRTAAERFTVCLAAAQALADELRVAPTDPAKKKKPSRTPNATDARPAATVVLE